MASEVGDDELRLGPLRTFQDLYRTPVQNSALTAPAAALSSLKVAAANAPKTYADYLDEAVECYERGLYRAAILMTWAATVEHLYQLVGDHHGGVTAFEASNMTRYGNSRNYRQIKKRDDLRYLTEAQFVQLGEDAGVYNRNIRDLLDEKLKLRNRCGHPTQYRPGREESVVFVESLCLNILSGMGLNW